ncbi:hypothetical protein Pfo_002346 [Paulownia fortunei]|nr:hypothetical protein Pfo_002346 [Paulownia fortunei]
MNAGTVKVISKVIIKPSSPTPHTLRNLKLSFLDQLVPPFYVPVIFFYQADELTGLTSNSDHAQISQQLKQSLSDALTSFYPLAGKLNLENFTVDCNDAGAELIEARVHARLSDAIQEPRMEELKQYLPLDPGTIINTAQGSPSPALLAVQISFFDCGGIAVGVCSSHHITDAASLVAFIGSWAAGCRGEKGKFSPSSFDLAGHFPSKDLSDSGISLSIYVQKEKLVTKRFVFDKEKLAALKQAATSPSGSTVKDPTRVEVVSAFIWKHFIEMGQSKNLSAAWHVVNLRTRTSLPLENVSGNCILKQFFFPSTYEGVPEFHDLVSRLRNGIRAVSDEYISKARNGDNYLNEISKSFDLVIKGEMESCGFSSWCRFPVYEVDYGWGKPVWVCPTSCPEKNVTFLMSTKDGDGIEAWVNMLESSSELLEIQFKLLGTPEIFK